MLVCEPYVLDGSPPTTKSLLTDTPYGVSSDLKLVRSAVTSSVSPDAGFTLTLSKKKIALPPASRKSLMAAYSLSDRSARGLMTISVSMAGSSAASAALKSYWPAS